MAKEEATTSWSLLSQKMKDDLDTMAHTLLAELCKGCGDKRYTQTHLIHNLLTWLSLLARYKDFKEK